MPGPSANCSLTVVDAAYGNCSITIVGALTADCNNPPEGRVGIFYDHFLLAIGGSLPITWEILSGSLPPGIALNAATGEVSGVPTTGGTYPFVFRVTDAIGQTSQASCSITIIAQLLASCGTPSSGTVGVFFSSTFTSVGGVPPLTWAITAGSLPPGIAMNASTGIASGVPTTAGTFNFTVTVTDAEAFTDSVDCSIVISPPPTPLGIDCGNPPDGTVGTDYTHTFPAVGGTPPYVFSILDGGLPPGLTLDPATGTVSGTPTQQGSFGFTIQVADSVFSTASVTCIITINAITPPTPPPIFLFCNNPPVGSVGVPYSHQIGASGGVPPYTFVITYGSLPPGLTMSPTGLITGTPTTAGWYAFQVTVTDSIGQIAVLNCGLLVTC